MLRVLVLLTALASTQVGAAGCGDHLRFSNGAFEANPNWEAIFDSVQLTDFERDRARETFAFFLRAYARRAAGAPLTAMRDPLIAGEAKALISLQMTLLDKWSEAVDEAMKARLKQEGPPDITHIQAVIKRESSRAASLMRQAHDRLARAIAQADGPTLGEFLGQQWLMALLLENFQTYYGTHKAKDFPYGMDDVDYLQERPAILAWLKGGTEPKDLADELSFADDLFATKGQVTLPTTRLQDPKARLALAFLPLRVVQLSLAVRHIESGRTATPNEGWVYDMGSWMTGANADLQSQDPTRWTDYLGRTWRVWYLLLGGQPVENMSVTPERERLLRALLYYARYLETPDEEVDWSDANAVIEHLSGPLLFGAHRDDWSEDDVMSRILETDGPALFPGLIPRGRAYRASNEAIASALDAGVARLAMHAGAEVRNEALRGLLRRMPRSAVTAKLLVLRVLASPPNAGAP